MITSDNLALSEKAKPNSSEGAIKSQPHNVTEQGMVPGLGVHGRRVHPPWLQAHSLAVDAGVMFVREGGQQLYKSNGH